mmetsp:Transcript_83205/g.262887  ORF Transcript_83205/g.262887 Transcript_83205/m.262887 type:complete len:213 (+) Transcript_83205:61-699(+)
MSAILLKAALAAQTVPAEGGAPQTAEHRAPLSRNTTAAHLRSEEDPASVDVLRPLNGGTHPHTHAHTHTCAHMCTTANSCPSASSPACTPPAHPPDHPLGEAGQGRAGGARRSAQIPCSAQHAKAPVKRKCHQRPRRSLEAGPSPASKARPVLAPEPRPAPHPGVMLSLFFSLMCGAGSGPAAKSGADSGPAAKLNHAAAIVAKMAPAANKQ